MYLERVFRGDGHTIGNRLCRPLRVPPLSGDHTTHIRSEIIDHLLGLVQSVQEAKDTSGDVLEIDNAIEKIFDLRTGTGWTTDGHTGEDVTVYAYGPGMEKFAGKIDNTDTAKEIFAILEKTRSSHKKE